MNSEYDLTQWPRFPEGSVVTLGAFDGLHRGHQALIEKAKSRAMQCKKPLVLLTFSPSPKVFFMKEKAPLPLFSREETARQAQGLGVDFFLTIPFTDTFSKCLASDFMEAFLKQKLNAQIICVGHDFCFGKGREGTAETLQTEFETVVLPPVLDHGVRISSTQIRRCLEKGDVRAAKHFLGMPYAMKGVVIQGEKVGRTLGVPTANLQLDTPTFLFEGVFAVQVLYQETMYQGVASLGRKETLGDEHGFYVEVHLFEFEADLYGQRLTVFFEEKIRQQERFESLDALKTAMEEDIQKTKHFFAEGLHER